MSALHEHATGLLHEHNLCVLRVVRVYPDAILYLGAGGRAMTGWLYRDGERTRVVREAGFPAWPTVGLVPRADARDFTPSDVGFTD